MRNYLSYTVRASALAASLILSACGAGVEVGDENELADEEFSAAAAKNLVTEARRYIGVSESPANSDCNPFSKALGRGCQEWCADFVNYIWAQGGMNTQGLSGASISFYTYANKKGTWKDGARNNSVKPGDGVIWANSRSWGEHIGMVTEVYSDGRLKVIHGNWHGGRNGTVYEGIISRTDQVGTGAPILGFAGPAKR